MKIDVTKGRTNANYIREKEKERERKSVCLCAVGIFTVRAIIDNTFRYT